MIKIWFSINKILFLKALWGNNKKATRYYEWLIIAKVLSP